MTTRRRAFDASAEAIHPTRSWVRETLHDVGIADAELAELATSELVANAIQHGAEPRSVVVRSAGRRARIEVHDGSVELPPATPGDGRRWSGLAIVDAFIERWGVDRVGGGKCVWFLVDGGATPPPRRSPR